MGGGDGGEGVAELDHVAHVRAQGEGLSLGEQGVLGEGVVPGQHGHGQVGEADHGAAAVLGQHGQQVRLGHVGDALARDGHVERAGGQQQPARAADLAVPGDVADGGEQVGIARGWRRR